MGIKGLKQFIKAKFPVALEESHLYYFWGKKVAMDLLPYLYRYKVTHGDDWRLGLLTLLTVFLRYNAHVTIIMDGPAVYVDKEKEREKRKKGRDNIKHKMETLGADLATYQATGQATEFLSTMSAKYSTKPRSLRGKTSIDTEAIEDYLEKLKNQQVHIGSADIETVQRLVEPLGIPFLFAQQEAESYASYLCRNGHVQAVVTEDSDVLAYGCPQWISSPAHNGTCLSVNMKSLLRVMHMNEDEFREVCILCGTDYNEGIPGVGPVGAYHAIQEYKSINAMPQATESLHADRVRSIFQQPCPWSIEHPSKPEGRDIQPFLYNALPTTEKVQTLASQYPIDSLLRWMASYPRQFDLYEE